MQVSRRNLLKSSLAAGAAATLPTSAYGSPCYTPGTNPHYAQFDEILNQPVFKRELFPDPVTP